MGIMKNKIIYFAILSSIIFLNILVVLKVGFFTVSIPKSELDLIFFMGGFITLLSSLVLPRILEGGINEPDTMVLLSWAVIEAVVTIGFVHSFLSERNVMMFYSLPALFQYYKLRPQK